MNRTGNATNAVGNTWNFRDLGHKTKPRDAFFFGELFVNTVCLLDTGKVARPLSSTLMLRSGFAPDEGRPTRSDESRCITRWCSLDQSLEAAECASACTSPCLRVLPAVDVGFQRETMKEGGFLLGFQVSEDQSHSSAEDWRHIRLH